jgi:hypothetical protein
VSANKSRAVKVLRVTVVAQVFAIVAAILISAPNFIDKLTQPVACHACLDFRGVDFVFYGVFFMPVALVLALAAWQLPWRPRLATALVVVIDMAILGLAAYTVITSLPYLGVRLDPDAPPYPWDWVRDALIVLPALANVLLAGAARVRRFRSG